MLQVEILQKKETVVYIDHQPMVYHALLPIAVILLMIVHQKLHV